MSNLVDVKFLKGNFDQLPKELVDGRVYFCEDNGLVFFDSASSQNPDQVTRTCVSARSLVIVSETGEILKEIDAKEIPTTNDVEGMILGALTGGSTIKPSYSVDEIEGLSEALQAMSQAIEQSVPSGTIVIWSGSLDSLPKGFQLCDGTNGTPDLRDKFVMGAGSVHEVGSTGGEETHALSIEEMPSHSHNFSASLLTSDESSGSFIVNHATNKNYTRVGLVTSTEVSGEGLPHNNLPPYYALAFIMKL